MYTHLPNPLPAQHANLPAGGLAVAGPEAQRPEHHPHRQGHRRAGGEGRRRGVKTWQMSAVLDINCTVMADLKEAPAVHNNLIYLDFP